MAGVLRNIAGILPSLFITLPFFTTINVLTESRELLDHLKERSGGSGWPQKRRYLWFTDTINDLNGVSETIQKLGWLTSQRGIDMTIVTCLLPDEDLSALPPNVLNLPYMARYTASFFDTYTLRIPSLLSSLKLLSEHEMDEIIISTPGPVGLLGQLCARLFHVPCSGIFHTDFSLYARTVLNDEGVAAFTEDYLRWFYSRCSTIRVPTQEYITILEQRGYDRRRMERFPRGIDKNLFRPLARDHALLKQRYDIPAGINLLYAGRISKEKNVSQLVRLYKKISSEFKDVNLILCGNGPDYDEYRHKLKHHPRAFMLGRLPRTQLPELYAMSDLFLFPSTTDTFGMVVLEAQACGLPAIVSDKGGPHEIVVDGKTGFVARGEDDEDWLLKLRGALTTLTQYPEEHFQMRQATREHIVQTYDWSTVLNDIFGLRHHLDHSIKLEHHENAPNPVPA
jgi:glycosyltransferase involved in cell wall biosynthesis